MSSPAPTPDLHTGFSAPGATPTPWADAVGMLESAEPSPQGLSFAKGEFAQTRFRFGG